MTSCGKSGCHDAASHKEGYVLDSYSNIVKRGIAPGNASKSELYKVIAGGEMPPKATYKTSDQVALIKQWIDEGAKNTTGCMVCDTSVYTYNGAISKIMTTNCTGCHSSVSKRRCRSFNLYWCSTGGLKWNFVGNHYSCGGLSGNATRRQQTQ